MQYIGGSALHYIFTTISLHSHYTALHSKGPWTIQYDVVGGVGCTNPGAPVFGVVDSNNSDSLLMGYKTWTKQGRCVGVVSATHWRDWPYDTFPLGAGDKCIGVAPQIEDPSNLWQDKRGTVHLLVHENAYGSSAHTVDGGKSWDFDYTREVYPYKVEYSDGTALVCAKREEPKVLIDTTTGLPIMLATLCRVDEDGKPMLPPTSPTKQWPKGEPQHTTQVVMQPINTAR